MHTPYSSYNNITRKIEFLLLHATVIKFYFKQSLLFIKHGKQLTTPLHHTHTIYLYIIYLQ